MLLPKTTEIKLSASTVLVVARSLVARNRVSLNCITHDTEAHFSLALTADTARALAAALLAQADSIEGAAE